MQASMVKSHGAPNTSTKNIRPLFRDVVMPLRRTLNRGLILQLDSTEGRGVWLQWFPISRVNKAAICRASVMNRQMWINLITHVPVAMA